MPGEDQFATTVAGSKQLRSLHIAAIWVSLLIGIIGFGKSVFFAGSSNGAQEAHLDYTDKRVDELYVRIDHDEQVWSSQLPLLQQAVAESERTAEDERTTLNEMQQQLDRRR